MKPDFEGFVSAQEGKRAAFGKDIPFFSPMQTVWPSGIAVDEEGIPLDPSVLPLASGFASGVVNAEVASRPVAGGARGIQPKSEDEAIGRKEQDLLILIVSKAVYDEIELADGSEVELYGHRYAVRDRVEDQMGPGEAQRVLIFVERK